MFVCLRGVYISGPPKSATASAFLETGAFLLLAAFLIPWQLFVHRAFCDKKQGAGDRRNSAEFGRSRLQNVGVLVAFRHLFLAGGVFFNCRQQFLPPFGGKVLPPESRYECFFGGRAGRFERGV